MNIYKILPDQKFLQAVTQFIIDNFSSKLEDLKVILPSGVACLHLQRALLKHLGVSILPTIVPMGKITTEGEEVFQIPTTNIEAISNLEEKVILAQIINDYKRLNFNMTEALSFSHQLASIFHEITVNDTNLSDIQDIPLINHAEHWHTIYEFLTFAYQEWQRKIAESGKVSNAMFFKQNLEREVTRLKQDKDKILLVATGFCSDKTSLGFLKKISRLSNGYLILPPIPELDDAILQDSSYKPDHPLYSAARTLSALEVNYSDLKVVFQGSMKKDKEWILEGLLNLRLDPDNSNHSKGHGLDEYDAKDDINIQYLECQTIFDEARALSKICSKEQNDSGYVGIVISSHTTKELYKDFLIKEGVELDDLIGSSLIASNECQLLLALSEFLCAPFNLQNLFTLLKHPLIISEDVYKLEKLLTGKNRFLSSFEELIKVVEISLNKQLLNYCVGLRTALSKVIDLNFHSALRTIISVAEELCEYFWNASENSSKVAEFFAEILSLNFNINLEKHEDFTIILRSLIQGGKLVSDVKFRKFTLCNPEDSLILDFDTIIIPDFSEGNWPKNPQSNAWLSKQMQEHLETNKQSINFGLSLYYFYNFLHNKTILTRSKKQNSRKELMPSSYMLKLEFIARKYINVITEQDIKGEAIAQPRLQTDKSADSTPSLCAAGIKFPNVISATDIEMLIRNPYGFYAKKVLGLRQIEPISSPPLLSEYGSFVHNVIELYTKEENANPTNDKVKRILEISSNSLNSMLLPESTKRVWQVKFNALALDFIEFDESQRQRGIKIYSEIKGSMKVNACGQEISIIAIADRIELDKNNMLTILDYKTGAVPSKKDLESGLSPQLIVESLIALDGGFGFNIDGVKEIVYVKIASSKPYIQTTNFSLTTNELMLHRQGLQNLLEHYVETMEFPKDIDLASYNPYQHLSRVIKVVN